jgi:hypothetical protein
MKRKYYAVIILTFLFAGCATYGELEADYGKSYYSALSGQILNPGASRNLEPVTGLPGAAASTATDKYIQSFGKEAQTTSKGFLLPVIPKDITGGQDAYEK